MKLVNRIIGALAVTVFIGAAASAQPLADRVPDDAIFYLGWCGSESLPPAYQGSHLQKFMDASNLPVIFRQVIPQLVARSARENADVGKALSLLTGILSPLARHETAIYFTGIDFSDPNHPQPHLFVLCRASGDRDALINQLTTFKSNLPADAPLSFGTQDDAVLITVGNAGPHGSGMLGASDKFKTALKHAPVNAPAAVGYLDGEKLLALAGEALALSKDPKVKDLFPKIRDASGLGGFRSMIWTSGFDGENWSDCAFVDAPEPRKGLLACENAPVSDDLLKIVPASAVWMSAGSFDLAAFVENVRTTAGEINPDAKTQIDKALGFVTIAVGRNFQHDILEPLGPQWAAYFDPSVAGQGFAGLVVVNKLRDEKKAKQGVNVLATFIANTTTSLVQRYGFSLSIRQAQVGDVSVNYLAMPLISPAWLVKDGNLYLSLYPQVCGVAARKVEKSILDVPAFVEMRDHLAAGAKPSSVSYADLKRSAEQGYAAVLMMSRLVLGFADAWGVQTPPLVVPPLPDLLQHLGPMGSVSWADASGIYYRSTSPFPGAQAFGGGGSMLAPIAAASMSASVLLPSLNRARESAERVKSASNLRQQGLCLIMYSNDHKGMLPPNLEVAVDAYANNGGGGRVILDSPLGDAPDGDYEYLGSDQLKITKISEPSNVGIAFDNAAMQHGGGTNVLFLDGHVEWVVPEHAQQVIAESREKLAAAMAK